MVHRTPLAKDAKVFALQTLREQTGRHLYPVHRLDRKTGGVLVFAFSSEAAAKMQKLMGEGLVEKRYLTIVRGYTPPQGEIDYALANEAGNYQPAYTRYKTLATAELPVALGKHTTSRYALVMAMPRTGRMHQIRKHFAHIFHPIIGDRPHGCNKQNRLFKERWDMHTMMLHAAALSFPHPFTTKHIVIKAPLQSEFVRMLDLMKWHNPPLFDD